MLKAPALIKHCVRLSLTRSCSHRAALAPTKTCSDTGTAPSAGSRARQNLTVRPTPQAALGRRRRHTAAGMPAASAKPSQGELTEAAMFDYGSTAPHPLIDIGANLADSAFDQDRDEVLSRAKRAGVEAIVITGSSLRSTEAAAGLIRTHASPEHPQLYFTAGVHPHEAKSCDEATIPKLRRFLEDERCVAVGECGLDFNRDFSPRDVQERWFAEQVKLALELRKPLFLHCRDAADALARILGDFDLTAPAVVHCFTGSEAELRRFVAMGLHIGITGWVCDERPERGGAELARLLPFIPRDRLMLETDAPYLVPRRITPSKKRPRRNEPALLPHVLHTVALALGEGALEAGKQTTTTAQSFFGIRLPDNCLTDNIMPQEKVWHERYGQSKN